MCLVKYIILNMDIYILYISAKMCKCACQKANVTEGKEELMADPGSLTDAQNGQIRSVALDQPRDWRTAYCRLKEEGDDTSVEEERERDWCWQVCILTF